MKEYVFRKMGRLEAGNDNPGEEFGGRFYDLF